MKPDNIIGSHYIFKRIILIFRRGFVFGIASDAFVFDLSDVTGVSVHFVVDDLFAPVREDDAVRAGHSLAIARFSVAEIVVRWLVFDGVSEAVRRRRLQEGKFK